MIILNFHSNTVFHAYHQIYIVNKELRKNVTLKALIVILVIFFHGGNGRVTEFIKIVWRVQNGGLQSTQGAAAWRQKRSPSDEPGCYTGKSMSNILPSKKMVTVPVCKRKTSFATACFSSMANNNNQRRRKQGIYHTWLEILKISFF